MAWQNKKRLRVLQSNKHYFEYDGKPIWLSGHSRIWTLTSFMAPVYEQIEPHTGNRDRQGNLRTYRDEIERVAESGGHLFRITPFWPGIWKTGVAIPWKQVEPGRFDLNEFDERYFADFRDFLGYAAENDIIVQMEVWDRPGLSGWNPSRWPAHPFNPDHNVNYGEEILPGTNEDGSTNIVYGKGLFYHTVHGENPELFRYQNLYIDRLVEECAPYPNIIYCIENEGRGGVDWERYWADRIRSTVPDALVTAMPHEPSDNTWRSYFSEPFSCLDGGGTGVRTATRGEDQNHEDLQKQPRSRTDMLIQIRDVMERYYLYMHYESEHTMPVYVSNSFGRLLDNIWAMFCSGAAGHRYHRMTHNENEDCYRWVKGMDTFLHDTGVPYWTMQPRRDLIRGHGFCLANGDCLVLYIPNERGVRFAGEEDDAGLKLRYLDADTGMWVGEETIEVERYHDGAAKPVEIAGRGATGTAVYCERVKVAGQEGSGESAAVAETAASAT